MNELLEAINGSNHTENGCRSYFSTGNKCLDFFFTSGGSRGKNISALFAAALAEDYKVAIATLLWLRDIRQGAGERDLFRSLVPLAHSYLTPEEIKDLIEVKIPEVGRYDDLKVFFGTRYENIAAKAWVDAIVNGNKLAAKWAPRKDKYGAKPLRKVLKMLEVDWRRFVVSKSDTVEQKMCAKKFDEITYSFVPSLAMHKYKGGFMRNDEDRFTEFLDAVSKGEVEINAGAIYPYTLTQNIRRLYRQGELRGPIVDTIVAQWNALPKYHDCVDSFLPVIDVSSSMLEGISGETTALDVAVGLGIYLAEHNNSEFKDTFITFETKPDLVRLQGSLPERVIQTLGADWDGSTNLTAVFELVLRAAVDMNVDPSNMPSKIIIVSDMQFNEAGRSATAFQDIECQYEKSGYKRPDIIFWQVNARAGHIPITIDENGTALVSGFSPAILNAVLSQEITPMGVFKDTVMVPRYLV